MERLSVSYAVYWELSFAPEYKWTKCGKCINSKTGRQVKQVYKNRSIGYYIRGKFASLKKLRNKIEKIEEPDCPF